MGQKKHGKASKSMKKYEKAWKSMKKHRKAWKSIEKYEKAYFHKLDVVSLLRSPEECILVKSEECI
ncbi:MAG: hypothetical protein K6E54_00205 [Bacteroidaceae bacterium]|nr:hypothetical protein [Bacteroidaceae bacterium]